MFTLGSMSLRLKADIVICSFLILLGKTSSCLAESPNQQSFGTLKGTILDASNGSPTACTIKIIDAKGQLIIENPSFKQGIRCEGHFEKRLPAGRTELRITRGFETRAVERVLEIPPGGNVEIKVALERIVDLRQRGWYGGDSHVHMLHGERTLPVDFDYVALTAQAEDLQYMSLAQAWTLTEPTPEKLQNELGRRSKPDCVLSWNLEAPKNYYQGDAGRCLGHCWMLGVKGRMPAGQNVIEVLLGASAHDYESQKPTFANFESHQLIHEQGGAVFYTHPARSWMGAWGGQGGYPRQERMRVSNMAVELPLDTLVGPTFDGVDLITGPGEFEANAMAFELWSMLLNHGYHLAGTASSDACFDREGGAIPGVVRTYTFLPTSFSVNAITKAAAQGANFATSGPLLLSSVDGRPPGSAFPVNAKPHHLKIEAWASGTDVKGLSRLELLKNGIPVQINQFAFNVPVFQTNLALSITEPAWYCLRVFGSDPERERAVSGAFFFNTKQHLAPFPVFSTVHVILRDSATGAPIRGSVTEVTFQGTISYPGKKHAINGDNFLTLPGTERLYAEAPGHKSQMKSPFLDNPALVNFITQLSSEDLLKWDTFEHIRTLLSSVTLQFDLESGTR